MKEEKQKIVFFFFKEFIKKVHFSAFFSIFFFLKANQIEMK